MKEETDRQPLPDDWLSYSCYAEMMRVEEQFIAFKKEFGKAPSSVH